MKLMVQPSDEPTQEPVRRNAFTAWVDERFRTPAAIYGLLVFQAFITIDSDDSDDVWEVFGTSVATLLVFFIAHVFAHVLTDHGEYGLGAATRRAMKHASGMLYAAVPASLVLLAGAVQGLPMEDVYDATMWMTLVVLAALGYAAYWRRGAHVVIRIIGALGTALLGILIVLIEYAVH